MRRTPISQVLQDRLAAADIEDMDLEVIAVGKVAPEMMNAAEAFFDGKVSRKLTIADDRGTSARSVHYVGEHPVPGPGSALAGDALVKFLGTPSASLPLIYLVSGGTSSLCVAPEPPVALPDLRAIWRSALNTGVDVTVLNRVRAAVSRVHGGGVLSLAGRRPSWAFILVDNVQSGAEWVGSGLTYLYAPLVGELLDDIAALRLNKSLAQRITEAARSRTRRIQSADTSAHHNVAIADTGFSLRLASQEAEARGYRVISLGSSVQGDVRELASQLGRVLRSRIVSDTRTCLIGSGEVTVRVQGSGIGGRCQEIALRMMFELPAYRGAASFAAVATDGQDHVPGVGGAWVNSNTLDRAAAISRLDLHRTLDENDSNSALRLLGNLLPGWVTGWNLCDIYVLCVDPDQ